MKESKATIDRMLAGMGLAIRKRRIELGLSQEELASKAGVHRTYISDIERGKRNMTITIFVQVADALDQRAEILLKAFLRSK